MIKYKVDIFQLLKEHGYNQSRIQKNGLLSGQTMQNIKAGKSITLETLNRICIMCRCQPSDIIEISPTDNEKIKFF